MLTGCGVCFSRALPGRPEHWTVCEGFARAQEDIARLSAQLAVLHGQFADKTAEQLELQVLPRARACR